MKDAINNAVFIYERSRKKKAMKKTAVLQFPGTNCDRDTLKALAPFRPELLFSADGLNIREYRAFVIPGGFSHGDYLRAGALAARSPAMRDVARAAKKGAPVLGICNGFQILCEARLLEGALVENQSGRFADGWSALTVQNEAPFWGAGWGAKNIRLPIAHGEGRYHAPPDTLKKLEDKGRIWLSYDENPNGSLSGIAGIMSWEGNTAGLMPHPERAMAGWMGGAAGQLFFRFLESA